MSWATPNFHIGAVVIEVPQSLGFTQTYEPMGGVATLRTLGGGAIRQTNWTKLRTDLSGDGMVPPGLSGIDWTVAQTLKCGTTRSITSASNAIALPTTRRTDTGYTPTGKALKDGWWISTPLTITSNVATLTTVSGAVAYMVEYYPQFSAFIDAPRVAYNRTAGTYQWNISAEEV